MKMTKYLFGLALLALGMTMASCDKENEGAIYTSAHNNVSWEQKAMETTTAEESIVVPVMITRNTKAGALTVSYTALPSLATPTCSAMIAMAQLHLPMAMQPLSLM